MRMEFFPHNSCILKFVGEEDVQVQCKANCVFGVCTKHKTAQYNHKYSFYGCIYNNRREKRERMNRIRTYIKSNWFLFADFGIAQCFRVKVSFSHAIISYVMYTDGHQVSTLLELGHAALGNFFACAPMLLNIWQTIDGLHDYIDLQLNLDYLSPV